MTFQQNCSASTMRYEHEGDASFKRKWNSVSPPSENVHGCFDCSICLDSAHDPVVTLCGHLYCWPCIYKWLRAQNSSFTLDERPKCPVCKSFISTSSLVPLYGRGTPLSESELKKPQLDLTIPQRPHAAGLDTLLAANQQQNHLNSSQPHRQSTLHDQQYFSHPFGNYVSMMGPTIGGNATTSHFSPTVNMVGELVFATMFGSSNTSLFAYPRHNSYPISGNSSSPRLRRQEMQLDKSLNRLSIFLFCCFILCLLLF